MFLKMNKNQQFSCSGKKPSTRGCGCFTGLRKFLLSLTCMCKRKKHSKCHDKSYELVLPGECHSVSSLDSLPKAPLASPEMSFDSTTVSQTLSVEYSPVTEILSNSPEEHFPPTPEGPVESNENDSPVFVSLYDQKKDYF